MIRYLADKKWIFDFKPAQGGNYFVITRGSGQMPSDRDMHEGTVAYWDTGRMEWSRVDGRSGRIRVVCWQPIDIPTTVSFPDGYECKSLRITEEL